MSTTTASKALGALCLTAFLVPFMGSALNLALPQISQEFSLNAVGLTWIATAYLIATAIFQIPFARLGDIWGRKKVFLCGVSFFSLCTFLSGFAPSGTILISLRALSGIGSAMMFGTNMAILSSLFPPEKRGSALGINVAVIYASLAAGPFLGGMLAHYFGWQSIFFVCGGLGLFAVVLAKTFIKDEWREAKGEKFDFTGAAIYGLALLGVILGCSLLPGMRGFIFLTLGLLGFVAFSIFERRCNSPVFNIKLFSSNRVFSLSSLAALINYASTSAIAFMMSLYLQYVKGFDARHAGMVLISQACIQSVCTLWAGRLADKYAPTRLASLGMAVIVVGLTGLIFIQADTSIVIIIILMSLLGLGFGLFSTPNTHVIMGSVDKKYYGQASAVTGTMRLSGQAFSMGIAGMALALQLGEQKIHADVYPQFMNSMKITFIIFALLCLLGVYASMQRNKTKR